MTRWAIPKILGHAAITTLFVVVVFAQAGDGASGQQLTIQLPEKKAVFPEPLPDDGKPGFALRGTKGWLWLPEQYLAEVATLASVKMNFMMICYGSMCDVEHYAWGDPKCNRWWEPLPEEKKRAYEKVIDACKANGVELCLSMNPNLFAERILQYGDENDFELLWQHYAWMQSRGMKWFCLSLDDISRGIDAAGQAQVANTLLHRLREKDAGAELILCPTFYWGDGTEPQAHAYLETLAHKLDEDIYLFWTGDAVVTPEITRAVAEKYRAVAKHRLIVWDNYPVNDGNPTLHLGPVTGRDKNLCEVCDGYMSNPMHTQNEINRIPLMTCADYAYNPRAYDPARSIGQAILHAAESRNQREALRDLAELYPGMLIFGKGTNFNPVIARMEGIDSRTAADAYLANVKGTIERFEEAFPNNHQQEKKTLRENLAELEKTSRERFGSDQ